MVAMTPEEEMISRGWSPHFDRRRLPGLAPAPPEVSPAPISILHDRIHFGDMTLRGDIRTPSTKTGDQLLCGNLGAVWRPQKDQISTDRG